MLFSIIIPVYNGEKVIRRCIDSLLAAWQQVENKEVEIIIVDDGSQDGTPTILAEYSTQYALIRVLHQENKGTSTARNAGMAEATGEWIGFVDADDYVEASYFTTIISALRDGNPEIFLFGFYNDYGTHRQAVTFNSGVYNASQMHEMFKACYQHRDKFWFAVNKIFKRSLLADVTFCTDIFMGEDTLFNLEVFGRVKEGTLKVSDAILYNYVKHPDSVTQSSYIKGFLPNLERQFEYRLLQIERYSIGEAKHAYYVHLADYFVNHTLFWLLKNAQNSPSSATWEEEMMRIRASKIYTFAFPYYKMQWGSPKRAICIKLFELRLWRLLKMFYR